MTRRRAAARMSAGLVLAGVLVGIGAGVSVAAGSAGPAGADPMASCTTTTGVIVAVDFSHWGGNVERGCAAAPATGYDALGAAGFTTAGDEQDGPAFICRIDDEPPPSEDPCITTPPATAYWSYWHADAGQSTWSESMVGAMSYQPLPGSVDGWAFGAGQPPSVPPSAVRATTPGPTPTSTSTAPTTGGGPPPATSPPTATSPTTTGQAATATGAGGTSTGGTGIGSATGPSPTPSGSSTAQAGGTSGARSGTAPGGGTGAPSSSTAAQGTAGATTTPGGGLAGHPRVVDVGPATAHPKTSTGSPLPAVLGGVVALGLGGTGGLVAWRRRVGSG